MDGMTITTETHIQARWIIQALNKTVSLARMLFKPEKSKCLVVRKGKVIYRFKLTIQKEEIPSFVNNPVKCLGKWFDSTLKDIKCQERLKQHVEEGLRRKSAESTSTGVLYDSKNWEMFGDLGKKPKVPEEVTHTSPGQT
jgi:hypothetical protein